MKAQSSATIATDRASVDIQHGIELYRNRDVAAAKLAFTEAIRADPHSADALTWRGIAENELKQYTDGAQDFQAALRIDPNEMSAHYNFALGLIRMGRIDDAITQLLIVTKANPGVVEPEYNLAILLETKKATADAAEHLKAAYETQPGDSGVAQHLLVDLFLLDRASEAQPILQQIRLTGSTEMRQQVGTALIEAGQFKAAVILLEDVHDQSQASHEVDLLLARAYIGAEEYRKAISLLAPVATADSTGESAYLLGLACSGDGDVPDAKNAFELAVKDNLNDSRPYYHLGLIESEIPEEEADALRNLRKAIQIEPNNPVYALAMARALLRKDQAQEALSLLRSVQPAGPEAAEFDLLLGIAQIATGSADKAIPTLQRAIGENPALPLSYNILGFCYFRQGDYAKAANFYSHASDMRPQIGIFAHDAAIAFERSSVSDKAITYALRASNLPASTGDDHYLLGKLFAKMGRTDEAIRELKEAVALSPELDAPYYLLARTYMRMGNAARAAEWNSKLTALKQKHERAYVTGKNLDTVTSSTLLSGAPMASGDTDTP